MRAAGFRRRFGGLVLGAALVVAGGCGSSPPASSPSSSSHPSPTTATSGPSAVGFSVNGAPAYGAIGPEGIPMEAGAVVAPVNPAVAGQIVDGVGCDQSEQLAYHHHIHLAIFVNGQARSVPIAVGIMPQVGIQQDGAGNQVAVSSTHCFYWLHVHAQDGVVHIESPSAATFTLGQLFDVWGQPLSAIAAGPAPGPVTATVNGQPYTSDPRSIPLNERDQIVLNVGGPAVVPPPVDWTRTQL